MNDLKNNRSAALTRLTWFFALAYAAHGLSAQFGLVAQPLQYFMIDHLGLTAADVSALLAVMMLPWVLKPVYGMLCDFVPLFGYRRKSYLILANGLTAVSLVIMTMASTATGIIAALLAASVGVAASTAVASGLAAEVGGRNGKAGNFFSLQSFCYYVAVLLAALAGGVLCQYLSPVSALHVAAAVASVPPLIVAILAGFMVEEEKSLIDRNAFKETLQSLRSVSRSRVFWLVVLYIWCWDFSPSFGVSLYYYQSKILGFSQGFIGQLGACTAVGMIIGALIYRFGFSRLSITRQLALAITAGVLSTLGYLLLSSATSAVVLELIRGITNMVSILALYGLAAKVCPPRSAVTVMAVLIAVKNLATEGATFLGGYLFTVVFDNQLAPLVLVAASVTALCGLIVPFLKGTEATES